MQSGLKSTVPVIGFCAYSGTGKTTLLIKLLPILKSRGVRVGVIKHTHHRFELDRPGKDSYELRKAGAAEMLVASGRRWALMVETGDDGDPVLQDMVNRMDQSVLDLIIVEGFKHEAFPKIELHRPELGRPPIFSEDQSVIAIASDDPTAYDTRLPLLDINDPEAIAEFIGSILQQK
ncbi:MAG: molybdopterin-guanine dinucleotide biosynthesis protein B [Chromatiaceae bacterium]|nr:molybdopterin-guanine dinucleotide biosynthesis protein B [Gammaproteobacteria bacterium]MCB1871891.1 molybdopterin-guanine dinucleotide biosynthesis protein B [Gammaproteobacteria bacterium]MCB1879474.1 molybdopterin-guanine dinucleotide biosynthesis protein B [Gammaproteobacteria bacterium]MCP5446193.1 molybdopterin-guanine dinucleotide biosynthesis protein B [Chromatiaceae bacterium]